MANTIATGTCDSCGVRGNATRCSRCANDWRKTSDQDYLAAVARKDPARAARLRKYICRAQRKVNLFSGGEEGEALASA